ncbi:MAG: hypothetical protein H7X80_04395 [bacterium]|nr:hypothetical protein [Candidatus Kapabacteria bacterium]
MIATFALYLVAGDALVGFAEMNSYISGYAQTRGGGISTLVTAMMREAPEKITVGLSGSVVVAIVGAILFALRDESRGGIQLLQFMLAALALLVVSLVVEGKYYPYQIARLQLCASVVSAYSIVKAVRYLWHRRDDMYVRIVGISMLALALVFSPITNWFWFTAAPVALRLARGDRAFDAYFDRMSFYYPRSELLRVGDYIRASYPKGIRVLTLSSIGGLVLYHSGSIPEHRIYHTCFLLGSISPPQWREEIRRYALEQRPEFIVAQRGDLIFDQTGTNAASITMIDTLGLREMMDRDYTIATETGTTQLVVYRHNDARTSKPSAP